MNKQDIPTPIYAAAGLGELAYEKLRKLPEAATRTAGELRQRLATRDRDLSAEWTRVRESAQRSGAALAASAASVPGRAATGYRNLVARGERVVASRFGGTTDGSEEAKVEVEVGPVQPAQRPDAEPRSEDQ